MPAVDVQALVRELPVFDAHADSLQLALDMGRDLGVRGAGHLDVERGLAGGLGQLVFVSWVDPKYIADELGGAAKRTTALLAEFHRLIDRHPKRVGFAGNGPLVRALNQRGALAGIPGIEGGHSIEGSLDRLAWFFERGVRVMTLVWNNHLDWIRSCQADAGSNVPEGLSAFGRSVVEHMNELGMLVDISHAGRQSFFDALDATSQPVIASHSNCKAIYDHQRNLDDDQLRALAQNGGVVGIVFCSAFIDGDARAEDNRLRATTEYKALGGANDTALFWEQCQFMQREGAPLELGRVLDHACHAIEIAGIDHVGIGSDFDGIQRTPRGLESAESYMALAHGLAERGLGLDDLRKVLGGNMRRVFARVTGPGTVASSAALVPLS